MANYVVGISGGSGAPYTKRVIEGLVQAGHDAKLVITDAGRRVFEIELGISLTGNPASDTTTLNESLDLGSGAGSVELFEQRNVAATIATKLRPLQRRCIHFVCPD